MDGLFDLVLFAALLLAGLLFGRLAERRHYRDIIARETALADILVFSERRPPDFALPPRTELVVGSVVIAEDYFKRIVRHLGLVQGSTVRAKHAGRDILAGLKNIVGGELTAYTELLVESRKEAVARMVQQAEAVGANAVLNVRFSTSNIASGAAEVMAYGTAVVIG